MAGILVASATECLPSRGSTLRILPVPDVSSPRPSLRILPALEPSFTERIIARLSQRESEERDPWLNDDYRQARLTVTYAGQGSPIPFVKASYALYGTHPQQIWEKITALRKADLGQEYSRFFDDNGNVRPQLFDIPDYDPLSELTPRSNNQIDVYLRRTWPKAPLRRVIRVAEVREDNRVLYHLERLECGHTHIEFLGANPGKRRRRCHECRGPQSF